MNNLVPVFNDEVILSNDWFIEYSAFEKVKDATQQRYCIPVSNVPFFKISTIAPSSGYIALFQGPLMAVF